MHLEVAIHNKNGKGLLLKERNFVEDTQPLSQSTIKMEKGYYLQSSERDSRTRTVAIHNKNGKGLLRTSTTMDQQMSIQSQSTIKMEKGYYLLSNKKDANLLLVAIHNKNGKGLLLLPFKVRFKRSKNVAIHNKNGKGLLHQIKVTTNLVEQ